MPAREDTRQNQTKPPAQSQSPTERRRQRAGTADAGRLANSAQDASQYRRRPSLPDNSAPANSREAGREARGAGRGVGMGVLLATEELVVLGIAVLRLPPQARHSLSARDGPSRADTLLQLQGGSGADLVGLRVLCVVGRGLQKVLGGEPGPKLHLRILTARASSPLPGVRDQEEAAAHAACAVCGVTRTQPHNRTPSPPPSPPPLPTGFRSCALVAIFQPVSNCCRPLYRGGSCGVGEGGAGTARRGAGSGSCAPGRPLSVASTPGRSGRSPRRRCNRGIVYPYMH